MSLELSGGATQTASLGRPIDSSKVAYQLSQPMGMVPDTLIAGALVLDRDEREWVPQAQGLWFKPLLLNVRQGYYLNILRVRGSGVLSRHLHYGPVHAFTLRGTWRYLEHDWVASADDYAFEPAGETHTLVGLRESTTPKLLVWGEDDQFQTVDYAERFAAEIPATRLVRIPAAGHIPMENDPRTVAGTLADFFAGR